MVFTQSFILTVTICDILDGCLQKALWDTQSFKCSRQKGCPSALQVGAVWTRLRTGSNPGHPWVSDARSMTFWAQPWFFIYLGLNKAMISPLSLPPFASGELISCLTRVPRQTGRQTEGNGEMMGVGSRGEGWHESNWKHVLSTCPNWAFYRWKDALRRGLTPQFSLQRWNRGHQKCGELFSQQWQLIHR